MRGNISNFTTFSKLFKLIASQTHQNNSPFRSNLLKIRVFSSFDGHNQNGQIEINSRNDFNGESSNFPSRNRGNLSMNTHQSTGEDDKMSHFDGQTAQTGRDSRSLDMKNDGFSKPIGSNDGSDYQRSMRELLHGPVMSGEEERRCNEEDEKEEVLESVDAIFNRMKQRGLIPNAVAMIDGLCKDGLVNEAMKIFGVMRQTGAMPEVVVYTAVVQGYCLARKVDDAKRVFRKMQSIGIVANAFSYNVLINGLFKATRLDEAVVFCLEMLKAGHPLNVPTFTRLVDELCKEKGLEDAKKVIVALKQKGFLLDEKAVRIYFDKAGPTSPMVWEAIFGPKKKA